MIPYLLDATLVLAGLYGLFVLSFVVGMRRLPNAAEPKHPRVSIVVAARDEERNIRACVEALLAQDYRRHGQLEIVIVNDRSTDSTRSILEGYAAEAPELRIVDIDVCPDGFSPKKFALGRGIDVARGEILCTTDADCVPSPSWVSAMVARFADDVGFVAGPAPLFLRGRDPGKIATGWLADFITIESLSGVALSAGGIGIARPWTCSGANLAYRRQAFDDVGGFRAVKGSLSGDDDLLMFLIDRASSWRLGYALDPAAVVRGYEDTGLDRLTRQRARRMSKFPLYPLRFQRTVLLLVIFYTAFALLPFYVLATGTFLLPWLGIVATRFGVELLAVSHAARRIGTELRLLSFIRAFVLHPVAIVGFGILGTLGRVHWPSRHVGVLDGIDGRRDTSGP